MTRRAPLEATATNIPAPYVTDRSSTDSIVPPVHVTPFVLVMTRVVPLDATAT